MVPQFGELRDSVPRKTHMVLAMANEERSCLSGFVTNIVFLLKLKRANRMKCTNPLDARLILAGRANYDCRHAWFIFFKGWLASRARRKYGIPRLACRQGVAMTSDPDMYRA